MLKNPIESMPNLQDIFKQAQKFQQDIDAAQNKLATTTIEHSIASGALKITGTAKKEITKIEISPKLLNERSKDILEDLILTCLNDFSNIADKKSKEILEPITPNFNL